MACKEKTKAIGEHEVYCRQWPAKKAIINKLKLAKMFGPAFARLAAAFNSDSAEAEISSGIEALFASNDPEAVFAFMFTMVESATIDGQRVTDQNFDDLFLADLSLFYKVMFFVLEVNYSDFFGGKLASSFRGKLDKMMADSGDGSSDTVPT